MAEKRVSICIQKEVGQDDLYFKEEDEKLLRELRERSEKEANEKYCEEHKGHCFRCGTQSLVEIDRGDVKIDICVNDNCGAVHLDPGELEEIVKDEKAIKNIRKSVFSIFSK